MNTRGLLATEESLDFLQAGDTQCAGEDTFFLETEVPLLFGEGAEFIRLRGKLEDGLSHRFVDGEEFEDGQATEVASTVAAFADFDFDRIPFGIDALVWRWGDGRVVQFGNATSGDP